MAKLSPMAVVKEKFESKEALAKIVMSQVERPEGLSDAEFERKIKTLSNRKLLKLNAAHEEMMKAFGSKEALVDAIVAEVCTGRVGTVCLGRLLNKKVARLLYLHKSVAKKAR